MQLLTIRAAGFTATVDACARDDGQVWFLSLLGNQQSVRARPLGRPRQGRDRLDHVIIGDGRFVSLKEQGVL